MVEKLIRNEGSFNFLTILRWNFLYFFFLLTIGKGRNHGKSRQKNRKEFGLPLIKIYCVDKQRLKHRRERKRERDSD